METKKDAALIREFADLLSKSAKLLEESAKAQIKARAVAKKIVARKHLCSKARKFAAEFLQYEESKKLIRHFRKTA